MQRTVEPEVATVNVSGQKSQHKMSEAPKVAPEVATNKELERTVAPEVATVMRAMRMQ